MIEISGLWQHESKDGKTKYITGNFGKARILIFKNNFKNEGSNEPDYIFYLEEALKKNEIPVNPVNDDIPF
ncbi:hypothetical protein [Caudoviricetes sp.]|nr:hypothetical protein [Caudoviricetes sp.]